MQFRSWASMLCLQAELGDMPRRIHPPACCSEMMVVRDRVRARPLAFWVDLLHRVQVPPPHPPPRAPVFTHAGWLSNPSAELAHTHDVLLYIQPQ